MTTQYDFHKTLIQISSGTYNTADDTIPPIHGSRAYSLLQKVNPLRSCFEAHIPEDYCPCFNEVQINASDAVAPGEVLVNFANSLLQKHNSVVNVVKLMDQKYSKENIQQVEVSLSKN